MKSPLLIIAIVLLLSTTSTSAAADRTLEHETEVNAPVAQVWRAFTSSQEFASWAVAKAKIDLRVGGEMRSAYVPTSTLDDEHTIVNRILAYDPLRMLSIQNVRAPAAFKNAELFQQTWSVIYFTPLEDDRTHVRIIGLGYGEGPQWDEIYNKFKAGNDFVLMKLREKFAFGMEEAGEVHADEAQPTIDPHNVIADEVAAATIIEGERNLARPVFDNAGALSGHLVGGEWIHESNRPDGSVFRVRNIYRHGPDGVSLTGEGWLSDAEGKMHYHGSMQIYRLPNSSPAAGTPQPLRFLNIDEHGSVSQGDIVQISEDTIQWNWELHGLSGRKASFRVLMRFTDADHYQFTLSRQKPESEGGGWTEMVNITFERVAEAPQRFTVAAP